MHSWSLVAFTLLTQSGVGLVWVLVVSRWTGPQSASAFPLGLLLALLLCSAGLACALRHLGTPRHALYAVRNLQQSWLSREILSVGAFAAAVALLLFMSLARPTDGLGILETACGVLGLLALHTMGRVYRIRSVPVWDSPATPLEFYGSALLVGGLLGGLIADWPAAEPAQPTVVWIFLTGGLTCKLAALGPARKARRLATERSWYKGSSAVGADAEHRFRIGMILAGVVLAALSVSVIDEYRLGWLAMALVACLAAECWGRWRFYRDCRRLGL